MTFNRLVRTSSRIACGIHAVWFLALIFLPDQSSAQTVGYFASTNTPYGQSANNNGLNIGQTFTVANTNIQVFSLGVFDYNSAPLGASHRVTLFSNQTAITSVTVPAGNSATLSKGFRYWPLAAPVTLTPGTYSVVAYQMNGTANVSDGYGDSGSPATTGFNGTFNLSPVQTIYEFTTNNNAYPGTGGARLGTSAINLAGASFTYIDSSSTLIAYTADPLMAQPGAGVDASKASGLNIGHTFNVFGGGIKIYQLGVFNLGGTGLNTNHTVTIFSNYNGTHTPVAGGSVAIPAGVSAPLANGFRFMPLATPITLPAGNYSIVAYQMNGAPLSDSYAEANASGVNATLNFNDDGVSPYDFVSAGSPAYPNTGANANLASVSFTYTPIGTNAGSSAAYTASTNGPYGVNGDNPGLNIGHTFTVVATNIQISDLGVYDYAGDGLRAAHPVTLFVNAGGTYVPITGGSVTVPSGSAAPLYNGYRYQNLPAPVSLPPATYAVVAYQMNGGSQSDAYSDVINTNNGFNGSYYLNNGNSVYEFTANASPNFPGTGGGASGVPFENFGCASFLYSLVATSSVAAVGTAISPLLTYVNIGQTVNLTASAFGTPPIHYQWYYGDTLKLMTAATNATLILTNIQGVHSPGNQGKYTASASNALGSPVFGGYSEVIAIPPISPIKILPLGDSITYGQGASGGYRAPLYQALTAAHYNVNFVGSQNNNPTVWLPQANHEGHSGYRIDQIASSFLGWVNSVSSPDIILLLIGTNDYGQNYDTANAANRLDQLIQLIATNQPHAKLIVANLTLRTDNLMLENLIETTFNPYVSGIVARHSAMGQSVFFVDLHSALASTDLVDSLHPNQSGYNKMATVWLNAITQVAPNPVNQSGILNPSGSSVKLTYQRVPGYQYVAERSTNLSNGSWLPIQTNFAPSNGMLQIQDPFTNLGGTPPAAFYRLLEQ